MEKGNNRVVGNWAWGVLLVVVVCFVIYGIFFTPKAYGETVTPTLTLERSLLVGELPYCGRSDSRGYDLRDGKSIELPPHIKRKVIRFLESHRPDVAEIFRNAMAVVAFVWDGAQGKGYKWTADVFYIPVNKDARGYWCGDSPTVTKPEPPPDDEVKELLAKKLAEKRK